MNQDLCQWQKYINQEVCTQFVLAAQVHGHDDMYEIVIPDGAN
jgi:hypothetical protein